MKKKITHYARFQFIYGLYSLLIALKHFEEVEDYLECHCILKGIEENEKLLPNFIFPKRFEQDDFDKMKPSMRVIQRKNSKKIIERISPGTFILEGAKL